MATTTKTKKSTKRIGMNAPVKKLTKKQLDFIKLAEKASNLGAKLYKEGKLKSFNKTEIYAESNM